MTIAASTHLSRNWIAIAFITAVHILAIFAFLPSNFSWAAIGLALALHWVTGGLGITLGWHRLASHRSFRAPKWLEYFLIFCGSLSMEGGVIPWVGLHRYHHLYSDQETDPHDSGKGFWWSHVGWMMHDIPAKDKIQRLTRDIANDPVYKFLDRYFLVPQVILAICLYALGGWPFVFWGIFVRLVLVFHSTWLVNSAAHKFGYRAYKEGDRATNCWWVALLTYGEGWHNNHHAFQYSARHGLKWWEVDVTWMTIRTLQFLGLAKKVKLPEENYIEAE